MKIGIMQPYIFPYIGYFQMINESDLFIFYDSVDYKNRGFINRNRILTKSDFQYFTVPVIKSTLGTKIHEIRIHEFTKWKTKFLKQLEITYSRAPYYQSTQSLIQGFLNGVKYEYISNLASESVKMISAYLGLNTEFILSSSISRLETIHGREQKLEWLIQEYQADTIILPSGSAELYENWQPKNVSKITLNMPQVSYNQFGDRFSENLSIIDVMMFNSKEQIVSMLKLTSYK